MRIQAELTSGENGMVKGWEKERHEEDSTLLAEENVQRQERGKGWERDKMRMIPQNRR